MLILTLICGFAAGFIVVYVIRHRKIKKQSKPFTNHKFYFVVCHIGRMKISKGKGMVNNLIYRGSSIYEEIPESPEAVYQNSGVQNAAEAHPPSLPGPRKGEPSNTESHAMKQNSYSRSPIATQETDFQAAGEDTTEECYTLMSPAGTLTVLHRNRNSSASLTPGWPLPGPPQ